MPGHTKPEWPVGRLCVPSVAPDSCFRLRAWHDHDAPALVAGWADPDVVRWTQPPEPSLPRALHWIQGWQQRTLAGLALDLVIEVDGTVAGEVGLANFNTGRRAAAMGYWLAPAARGQGLASQAAEAIAGWFLRADGCGGDALVATCHKNNEAAHRVAKRAGFSLLGTSAPQPDNVVFARRAEKGQKDVAAG